MPTALWISRMPRCCESRSGKASAKSLPWTAATLRFIAFTAVLASPSFPEACQSPSRDHETALSYFLRLFRRELHAMPQTLRPGFAILAAALLLVPPALAFQSPLSDEAIRDAYFLGQRHDEATANLFLSYLRTLPQIGRAHV